MKCPSCNDYTHFSGQQQTVKYLIDGKVHEIETVIVKCDRCEHAIGAVNA